MARQLATAEQEGSAPERAQRPQHVPAARIRDPIPARPRKAQLALQSQYLIDHCGGADALLCVGAAGSLSEALRVGDIVAGRAAVFSGLGFLELRCITDGADVDAALSFREHCARVMPNVAELIAAWFAPAS